MFRTLILVLAVLAPLPAEAMQFQLLQSDDGRRAVLAQGDIVGGDAQRLASALRRATRDSHGTKMLLLDSPGGVVVEAMDMADVMRRVGVTTVIPEHGFCASACASVLFVAGKYRTIEPTGRLAIHSCYDSRNGQKMDECDAAIAVMAQRQGVSATAMMAFQEMAPDPGSAIVFDSKDAACFGLTRAPGKAALGDKAPCVQQAMRASKKKR
jgi:hypothetical protein